MTDDTGKKEIYEKAELLAAEKRIQWQKEAAILKEYEKKYEKQMIRRRRWVLTLLISVLLIFALISTITLVKYSQYNRAAAYYIAGEYVRAANAFMEMADYRDSKARVYESAVNLYRQKRYEEAYPYFVWLDGYMDKGYYLRKCQEQLTRPEE